MLFQVFKVVTFQTSAGRVAAELEVMRVFFFCLFQIPTNFLLFQNLSLLGDTMGLVLVTAGLVQRFAGRR